MKALQNFQRNQHLLVVDALRYSLVLENKAFQSLLETLALIESNDDGISIPDEELVLIAIRDSWQIIDFVHRIRGLISQAPGLPQKTPAVQLFKRHTIDVEGFRNLYQHLNSSIAKIQGNTNPIMGVISWVFKDPSKSLSLNVGTGAEGLEVSSIAIDIHSGKFAQNLLFAAGKKEIDLEKLHLECVRLSNFLNSWLAELGHLKDEDLKSGVFRILIVPTA